MTYGIIISADFKGIMGPGCIGLMAGCDTFFGLIYPDCKGVIYPGCKSIITTGSD